MEHAMRDSHRGLIIWRCYLFGQQWLDGVYCIVICACRTSIWIGHAVCCGRTSAVRCWTKRRSHSRLRLWFSFMQPNFILLKRNMNSEVSMTEYEMTCARDSSQPMRGGKSYKRENQDNGLRLKWHWQIHLLLATDWVLDNARSITIFTDKHVSMYIPRYSRGVRTYCTVLYCTSLYLSRDLPIPNARKSIEYNI